MRILILGGDGYLGWPTAMYLSRRGHDIAVADNFAKRRWEAEIGIEPLVPVPPMVRRISIWREVADRDIGLFVGDLQDPRFVDEVLEAFRPEAIVHYGEQPSAPYSMVDQQHAVLTQVNNITGTLNVLFAMKRLTPDAHLVKLGTMGEYGTPNIEIEEGFIEIHHKGRSDVLPFPKQPGSFYHLSKVHDSHNIMFAARTWGLRATDLNQGVVYGVETDETRLHLELGTSFHYDHVFGTALNRFCAQAVVGCPLTVYGKGGQRRGFLNIMDTMRCVELSVLNPPTEPEYRVFNQFTEVFSVLELAEIVRDAATRLGFDVKVAHLENPRTEKEDHYYNPQHQALLGLGLEPRYLSDVLLEGMLGLIHRHCGRIDRNNLTPTVFWRA